MNYKTFNLIDKINASGLDNSQWNINMHLGKQTQRNSTEQEIVSCSLLESGSALLRKSTVIFLSVVFARPIMF